jgi:hypothetical protein
MCSPLQHIASTAMTGVIVAKATSRELIWYLFERVSGSQLASASLLCCHHQSPFLDTCCELCRRFISKVAAEAGVNWNPKNERPEVEAGRQAQAVTKAAEGTAFETVSPGLLSEIACLGFNKPASSSQASVSCPPGLPGSLRKGPTSKSQKAPNPTASCGLGLPETSSLRASEAIPDGEPPAPKALSPTASGSMPLNLSIAKGDAQWQRPQVGGLGLTNDKQPSTFQDGSRGMRNANLTQAHVDKSLTDEQLGRASALLVFPAACIGDTGEPAVSNGPGLLKEEKSGSLGRNAGAPSRSSCDGTTAKQLPPSIPDPKLIWSCSESQPSANSGSGVLQSTCNQVSRRKDGHTLANRSAEAASLKPRRPGLARGFFPAPKGSTLI